MSNQNITISFATKSVVKGYNKELTKLRERSANLRLDLMDYLNLYDLYLIEEDDTGIIFIFECGYDFESFTVFSFNPSTEQFEILDRIDTDQIEAIREYITVILKTGES